VIWLPSRPSISVSKFPTSPISVYSIPLSPTFCLYIEIHSWSGGGRDTGSWFDWSFGPTLGFKPLRTACRRLDDAFLVREESGGVRWRMCDPRMTYRGCIADDCQSISPSTVYRKTYLPYCTSDNGGAIRWDK
jgi:hypothetical protein